MVVIVAPIDARVRFLKILRFAILNCERKNVKHRFKNFEFGSLLCTPTDKRKRINMARFLSKKLYTFYDALKSQEIYVSTKNA